MKTVLENFITNHGLDTIILAQAIEKALEEERQMLIKAYKQGCDDTLKSVVDDSIPNGERYYNKIYIWS